MFAPVVTIVAEMVAKLCNAEDDGRECRCDSRKSPFMSRAESTIEIATRRPPLVPQLLASLLMIRSNSVARRVSTQLSLFALLIAAGIVAGTGRSPIARAAEATITPASSLKATSVSSATSAISVGHTCDANCNCAVRPFDQVWLLSTRRLGCPGCTIADPPAIAVMKRTAEQGWTASSLEEFFATDDPCMPTCIAIHGNQVDSGEAFRQGMLAYCRLIACFPDRRPVRFVIWSWPSQKMHGILQDVRVKAARTPIESKYLGWVLNRIKPETEVSLVGFSYGAADRNRRDAHCRGRYAQWLQPPQY